ncbi:unnamed protein product, partial [marine sediment metagenome]
RKDAKFTSKAKLKKPYYVDDLRVPGVSTVCGVIDKSGPLMWWAADLARKGIDYMTYRDELAEAGRLVHDMILAYFLGMEVDTYQNSQWAIDKAKNSFKSFENFISKYEVEPIEVEHELISPKHLFGGRMDFYGKLDGVRTLMDFKTGKRIYDDYFFQSGGYAILLDEFDFPVDQYVILNIPRSKGESFEVAFLQKMKPAERVFKSALGIYWAMKDAKKIMKTAVERIAVKEPKAKDPIEQLMDETEAKK